MIFFDDAGVAPISHVELDPADINYLLSAVTDDGNDTVTPAQNTSYHCPGPLVPLPPGRHSKHRIPTCAFKRCTERCMLLLYEEHELVEQKVFVGVLASFTFVFCLVALLTLAVNKHSDRFRPTSCLWALYSCYLVGGLAYFVQFLSPDFKRQISCLSSDAERIEEPDSTDGALCMLTFILLYPSSLAAEIWFVHLTHTWSSNFKRIAKAQRRPIGWIQRKVIMHSTAWIPPLVCTVLACTFHVISGDTVVGVCFIDNNQLLFRLVMWVAPTAVLAIVAVGFASRGIYYLRKFYMENSQSYSVQDMKRVQRTSVHLGVTTAIAALVVFIRAAFQVILLVQESTRVEQLETYVQCIEQQPQNLSKLKFVCGQEPPENRHSREGFELVIYACWFVEGLAFSAFVFTPTYMRQWRIVFRPITMNVLPASSWWNREENGADSSRRNSGQIATVDKKISTNSVKLAGKTSVRELYSENAAYNDDDELTTHVDAHKSVSLSPSTAAAKSYDRQKSVPLGPTSSSGSRKATTLDPRGLLLSATMSYDSHTSSAMSCDDVDDVDDANTQRLSNWQARLREQKRSTATSKLSMVSGQSSNLSGGGTRGAVNRQPSTQHSAVVASKTMPRFRGDDVDEYQFHSAPYYLVRRKSQASPKNYLP